MILEFSGGGGGLWVHMMQLDLKFIISEDREIISKERVRFFQRGEAKLPCQY